MSKILSKLYKCAIKVAGEQKLIDKYKVLNSDIMSIVNDIEKLKYYSDQPKIQVQIAALERTKTKLEKYLIELEEEFYDVSKGLWLGLAYDLTDIDKPAFLLYLPWNNLKNHIEVFGTSGFGKSRLMALMTRQFIHFGWSIFEIDPKGGEKQIIAQWIYDFAAEAGLEHLVTRIMPTYPELSDKGNVLFGMSDVEIASMGASLTISGSGTQTSDEQFYSGQVYQTLFAILSSMSYLENAIDPYKIEVNKKIVDEVKKYIAFKERKNIPNVYNDAQMQFPDVSKIAIADPAKFQLSTSISAYTRTLVTFRELAYFSIYEHLMELRKKVEDVPVPKLDDKSREREIFGMKDLAIKALDDVTKVGKEFYDKIGKSLSVLLSQLSYGPVGSVLCDIRINPLVKRARSKEGMIVLFQPCPMRFEKVSEILIKVYTRMWLSLFGTVGATGRGIHKRVAMVIDEAKPMMFPGVEEIYNKARELGMSIVALYQSTSDIKFKLGDVLADIAQDNTATSITMKQMSESSREQIAKAYGTVKVAQNVQMSEASGIGGRSTTVWNEVDVVSADDIDALQIGEAYIRHYGKKYFVKFPYQRDPMPINVTMPKLESESVYEFIDQVETMLKMQEKEINNINMNNPLQIGA